MKVGFLTDQVYWASLGYSIRVRELTQKLGKLGVEVHIFSPIDDTIKISNNLCIHGVSRPIPFNTIFKKGHTFLRTLYKNPTFGKYLYRKKFLHYLSKRLVNSFTKEIQKSGIQILQGEREISSMAAIEIGRKLDIPVVSDIRGLLAEEAVGAGLLKGGSIEYYQTRDFVLDIFNDADKVLVVSEDMKQFYQDNYMADSIKFEVISNAGNIKNICTKKPLDNMSVVYSGILEYWENVQLFIKSIPYILDEFPDAHFFIAGDGSLNNTLRKLSTSLNISKNLKFVGIISYDEIFNFLNNCTVAVLPSTQDTVRKVACPIKLFDYLSVGLPVVTVNVGWWSDLICKKNVGVVADCNPKAFGNSIISLLQEPEKRKIMGQNGKLIIKNEYNWYKQSEKLYKVYEGLL